VLGKPGSAAGQFLTPEGITVDTRGNVYVAETDSVSQDSCNCRVQKLSPTGKPLAVWK